MSQHSSSSFVFISDTHDGNNFGICTPDPELPEGQYYHANALQQKLYDGYQQCLDRIKQPNKIHALFIGGDMVDGVNPKKPGQDLWTNDPLVAIFDFNKLLWPIASKATKVFGIRGSDYHVTPDRTVINYDELACQMVGTDQYKTKLHGEIDRKALADKVAELRKKGKKRSEIKLDDIVRSLQPKQRKDYNDITKKLDRQDNIFKKEIESIRTNKPLPYPLSDVKFKGIFGRVAIVLKHYVSFSPNYMYRGTGLIRNDLIQTLQKDRHFPDGYSKIIYAYGHVHYYHTSGNDTHTNFTIPCFKANDTYLRANGVTEPDYGLIEVIVEPNEEIIVYPYTLRGEDYPVQEPYKL
jgi:hypothetical protein